MRWLEEEIKGLCDWFSKANDDRFTAKRGLCHYFMCTNCNKERNYNGNLIKINGFVMFGHLINVNEK
jgi:hypothetical protein